MNKRHPMQPLELDPNGTLRFKENAIVRYLLDAGDIDMNRLAKLKFSNEDRQQFAQLIGYSLSGFGELSYVPPEMYETAERMFEEEETELQARITVLENTLEHVKDRIREGIAFLFNKHPDDLL